MNREEMVANCGHRTILSFPLSRQTFLDHFYFPAVTAATTASAASSTSSSRM